MSNPIPTIVQDWGNSCFWLYIEDKQYQIFKKDIESLRNNIDQQLQYYNEHDELCSSHDKAMGEQYE